MLLAASMHEHALERTCQARDAQHKVFPAPVHCDPGCQSPQVPCPSPQHVLLTHIIHHIVLHGGLGVKE
jgi:hypothetical protein